MIKNFRSVFTEEWCFSVSDEQDNDPNDTITVILIHIIGPRPRPIYDCCLKLDEISKSPSHPFQVKL